MGAFVQKICRNKEVRISEIGYFERLNQAY